MSIQRSQLIRGPGIVTTTLNTVRTLFTKGDITIPLEPNYEDVTTSQFGVVDQVQTDRVYKVGIRLWGAWENLDLLFPSYALAPQPGASIFGNADTNWTFLGNNGDQILFRNMQVTGLSNLYLGVDQDLFAADVQLTALIGNNVNPEAANAYYTISTGNAYANNVFTKANYKRARFTGAWGALAGFTAFAPQKGVQINWALDAKPLRCDGLGTVDMTVGEKALIGTATCIPVQNTMAQLEAQAQAQGVALGTLLSNISADLVLTSSLGSPVITLKSAAITKQSYMFGAEPLRQGPVTWRTTRGFNAGAPNATATVA